MTSTYMHILDLVKEAEPPADGTVYMPLLLPTSYLSRSQWPRAFRGPEKSYARKPP